VSETDKDRSKIEGRENVNAKEQKRKARDTKKKKTILKLN